MSLRLGLLGLLADGPKTGYELFRLFGESLNHVWPASHSQIYPELARLAAAGLIEEAATGPRRSRRYGLTASGLAELRRWLRETEPSHATRNEPLLRVFFLWLLEPEEAENYLRNQLAAYSAQLARFEAYRSETVPRTPAERSARLALEAGIRVLDARIEWAAWATDQVRGWATAERTGARRGHDRGGRRDGPDGPRDTDLPIEARERRGVSPPRP